MLSLVCCERTMAACRSVFCWGRLVCTVPKAIVLGMRHGVREASKVEVEVEVSVLGRQCMRRAGAPNTVYKAQAQRRRGNVRALGQRHWHVETGECLIWGSSAGWRYQLLRVRNCTLSTRRHAALCAGSQYFCSPCLYLQLVACNYHA